MTRKLAEKVMVGTVLVAKCSKVKGPVVVQDVVCRSEMVFFAVTSSTGIYCLTHYDVAQP